jgi:hypothetical protein
VRNDNSAVAFVFEEAAMIHSIHADRRKGARYAMKIPIRVSEVGTGSTVDVSSSGVSFMIAAGLALGTIIDFDLTVQEPGGAIVLECGGTVVRAEQRGRYMFAAATIDQLIMRTAMEQ